MLTGSGVDEVGMGVSRARAAPTRRKRPVSAPRTAPGDQEGARNTDAPVDFDLHSSILEALDEGILVLDRDAIIVACNPSAARLFEAQQEDLVGSLLPMDRTTLPDGSPVDVGNSPAVRALRTGEMARDVSLRVTRLEGGERWVSVNYQPLRAPDDDDEEPRGVVISITDVTDRRRDEMRVAHLAFTDVLTGLPNRAALEQALGPALARVRRNGRAAALIYLDLDQFKVVNDSLGHAAGDEVLRQVAARLTRRVRAGDMLARLSGDEFMLMLPDLGVDAREVALQVAADLVGELEAPIVIGASEFEIGASAGIALYPRDGEHGIDDPISNRVDQPRLLGERDELEGRYLSQVGIPPPDQRLDADR